MSLRERAVGNLPVLLAAGGSLALSALALAREPMLNNDGARYLAAAEAYTSSGFAAAVRVYPWPFYSVMVGGLAAVTGSTLAAARLLDTLLLAAASAAFVLLVARLGGGRLEQWIAAGLVLTHPAIGHLRAVIARDFGAWTFALLGMIALLGYIETGRPVQAAGWAACGAAAVVFRPEAIVLWSVLCLAPLIDPALGARDRVRRATMLAAFPILALATVALATAGHGPGPPLPPLRVLAASATAGLHSASRALASGFPFPHGREYAPYILLWGLTLVPIAKLVRAIGLGQAALAGAGAATAPATRGARRTLWLGVAGAALPLLVLLPMRLFLETRYAIVCSLFLLAFAPFGAAALVRGTLRQRALAAAAILLIGVGWGRDLAVAPEKDAHLRAAGQWLAEHAPAAARVHTNSPQVAYYSRRAVDWNEVESSLLGRPFAAQGADGDFVAIATDAASRPLAGPAGAPIASFSADEGRQVVIYGGQAAR